MFDDDDVYSLSNQERKAVLEIIQDLIPQIIEAIIQVKNSQKEVHFEDVLDASPALFNTYQSLAGMEFPNLRKKKDEIQSIINKYTNQLIAVHSITTDTAFSAFITQAHQALGKSLLLKLYQAILDNKTEQPTALLGELLPDLENKTVEKTIRGIDVLMHLPPSILNRSLGGQIALKFIRNAIVEQTNPTTAAKRPTSTTSSTSSSSYSSAYSGTHFKPAASNASSSTSSRPATASHSQPSTASVNSLNDLFKYKSQMDKSIADLRRNSIISSSELFQAISDNSEIEVLEEIIARKPYLLQAKDGDGNNALHVAVVFQKEKTVEWLIKQGVDANHVNRLGQSVVHMAIASGSKAAVSLIKQTEFNQSNYTRP